MPIISNLYNDVGFIRIGTGGSYLGPADQFSRFIYRVFTSGIIPWPSPCGSNCSYRATFYGPAYNCIEVYDPPTLQNNTNLTGPCLFFASDIPGNLSAQGLWMQFSKFADPFANLTTLQCQLHNTTYDISVEFRNNQLNVTTDLSYHEQVNNSLENLLATEIFENPRYPVDPNTTWALANYYTVSDSLIGLISGCAQENSVYGAIAWGTSSIYLSTLVDEDPIQYSKQNSRGSSAL